MSKFHISPKTGRAGACRAKEGGCPFGEETPHFKTKEEAKAYIAGKAAAENSMFTTTRKAKKGSDVRPEPAEIISKVVDPKLAKRYMEHELREDTLNFWGISAEVYYPGCNSCLPPYDDFCQCGQLTGEVEIDSDGIASEILNKISGPRYKSVWDKKEARYITPSPEDNKTLEAAINSLTEVIKESELVNRRNWDLSMRPGHYGEEVESIYFTGDKEKVNAFFEKYFLNK